MKECYNVDGSASQFYTDNSVTTWGCGSDLQSARNNAALSLASGGYGCIKDAAIAGCCTYTAEPFQGCFCK